VSLEQFKTQILLLHSEQSTLDNFSTGFNDRYTIHCATSGSEALNTLGQTEIDVIVTAQELPGMSGIDALREAKKRSPDTVGILIAGDARGNLEALVGDLEIFQIVRGTVTPTSLRQLVDDATRQSRLMTLAESANDTAADVDMPHAEHIVMETSENGSAIISDGTGRMPILDPKKVSAKTSVGSRAIDVLVLTKDEEFLTTVKDSARGMHNIIYANTLAQADDAVRNHKVGVAVIDAAMVGSNVEKLTVHLRSTEPRLVAIVAGRRDDGEMLMDLINRGKVYRFLLKPVSPGRARLAIEASVKHHLEAPETAFKTSGAPAKAKSTPPKRAAKKKVAKKKAAKKTSASEPRKARARTKQSQSVPSVSVSPRPVPVSNKSSSPTDNGRFSTFGGDDDTFTGTFGGMIKSVGDSLSSAAKREVTEDTMTSSLRGSASGGSFFGKLKSVSVGATAIAAALGIGWWTFGGFDSPAPTEQPLAGTPSVTEADPAFETAAPAPRDASVRHLLGEARLADAAGQIYNPPGSNSIEFYLAATKAAPNDAAIRAALAAAVDQALSMAETSLLDRRSDDADAALTRVALADPRNERLPFLNAQLIQMQSRYFLDSARLAIREARFEDAAVALDGARALGSDNNAEIGTVNDELRRQLGEQHVDDVLLKANARLAEGKLTAPSNDNARYYFELVLSKDPGNSAARQGVNMIASKLILQARVEIDAGQLEAADILLADARRLNPTSSKLAESTAALDTALMRLGEDQALVADVNEYEGAEPSVEISNIETVRENYGPPTGATETTIAKALGPMIPVSIRSLTRTKYVAPKYPRAAQRRNVSGWVDVEFTVTVDGMVRDVSIRGSDPGVTFVNAAVSAVEDWEFKPSVENGLAVEKRAAVRMMFALE
jgi:serine/threonine-protein kinase